MAGGFLEMSSDERERLHLVRAFMEARIGQREASERLGIGVRQFKRLVRAWRQDGDAGLVSGQRGRPSTRRLNDVRRAEVVTLLRDKYVDFGATLASEKLLGLDGIEVSVETVRQMQISLGLWKPKARRAKRVFQLRERRPRFGQLIQIDGSPHDWFEGRGPRGALIVFIDDATGRLTALRFAPVESGQARPGGRTSGDRVDQRADAPGEGPGGTSQSDASGPPGQGDAVKKHMFDLRCTGLSSGVHT
jgi:transposase